jgi:hypothetical protein
MVSVMVQSKPIEMEIPEELVLCAMVRPNDEGCRKYVNKGVGVEYDLEIKAFYRNLNPGDRVNITIRMHEIDIDQSVILTFVGTYETYRDNFFTLGLFRFNQPSSVFRVTLARRMDKQYVETQEKPD